MDFGVSHYNEVVLGEAPDSNLEFGVVLQADQAVEDLISAGSSVFGVIDRSGFNVNVFDILIFVIHHLEIEQ